MLFNLAALKRKFLQVISSDLLRSSASIYTYVNTTIPTCLMINVGVNLFFMVPDVMVGRMVVVVVLALDVCMLIIGRPG